MTSLSLILALSTSQLGWEAGTPRPVLDENPEFVALYWKAWETYHATVRENTRVALFPTRYSAIGDRIRFDEAVNHCLYAKWGLKAAPVENMLRFLGSRVDARGAASAEVSISDGVGTGEATGFPTLALAVWDLFQLSGDDRIARDLFAPVARRGVYMKAAYSLIERPDPSKPAFTRMRVPVEFSEAPHAERPAGIIESAEAHTALLMNAEFSRRLAGVAQIRHGEAGYEVLVRKHATKLESLLDPATTWPRGKDSDNNALEPLTLIPFWSAIGGRMNDFAKRISKTLSEPSQFGRWLQYPTVAASEIGFAPDSGVKPFHQYLSLRALLDSGQRFAAGFSAENMLKTYARAAGAESTLYSEYGPDSRMPAPFAAAHSPDAGAVAIAGLIEALIGISVDAKSSTVSWNIWRRDRHGLQNLRFGDCHVGVVASARDSRTSIPEISVQCEREFTLRVTIANNSWTKRFSRGSHTWIPG